MTFVRKNKVRRVTLTEGNCAGLTLQTRMMSVGAFTDMLKMFSEFSQARDTKDDSAAMTAGAALFESFADVLMEWDMVDENHVPVPATMDGLRTLDLDDGMELIEQWMGAMSSASEASPLDRPSSNGGSYPEVSIPMERLSANPLTSPTLKW